MNNMKDRFLTESSNFAGNADKLCGRGHPCGHARRGAGTGAGAGTGPTLELGNYPNKQNDTLKYESTCIRSLNENIYVYIGPVQILIDHE